MDAIIPVRIPIGMERLPPFLSRKPDKDNDKSQSPGIACRDLKTQPKEKVLTWNEENKTDVD